MLTCRWKSCGDEYCMYCWLRGAEANCCGGGNMLGAADAGGAMGGW